MKGLMKSLESIISVLMIFMVFIVYFGSKEALPEFETISWQLKGINSLKVLDQDNELRQYVLANNSQTIENKLIPLVPPEINIKVVICQFDCQEPDVQSEKLVSVSYMIAGDVNDFRPRQIVLYMW